MQSPRSFPDSLTTARFRLRRYIESDATGVTHLIERNRTRLLPNFPELARDLREEADIAAWLDESDGRWRAGVSCLYGIWPTSEATPIGQLRVKNIVWNVPSAELSYFVDRDWLRRGVATEAVRAVLREAFEGMEFKRVYVRIIAGNEESLALAHRLGFQHEGLHRKAFRCGLGELHDVHLLALTDRDYGQACARQITD